jgi:anti-sigma factor RsiW
MTSEPQPTLLDNDHIREELVAYLDGELDSEESLRVERRLAEDAHYRRALQELERAWDLLDTLPRSEPDETFTRSTVEMVALSAASDVDELRVRARRRRAVAGVGLAASLIVALLAGFGAVYWKVSAPNRELVRDLPVIEHMEYYRHAESLEFLRRLDAEGLFSDEVDDAY